MTDSTAPKIRKRDTGEKGNRGEFGTVQRAEAQVTVPSSTPSENVELPDEVIDVCRFYGMTDLQATRRADGSLRIGARGRVITDEFEDAGIDPDLLCQQINLHHPDADAHVEDVGTDLLPWDDVVYSFSITSEGEDAASIDHEIFDHPLALPWDSETQHRIWQEARAKTSLRKANAALEDYVEQTRTPRQTTAQARARAAHMIYRVAAEAEAREAIDGLRDLGARHGAAYVSFPGSDDIDDSSLLSAHPVFWGPDGEVMEWHEAPEIENGDEYAAWMFADRDEVIVSGLAPNIREDPELDAMSNRTDHAFMYRCTPGGV